jgi:AhpD family alkylhydroperoxidase
MNWSDELHATNGNLENYRSVESDTAKGFTALHRASMKPGAVSAKEKELIALAIGISKQCVDCIGFNVKASIAAGATRQEIAETVSVCVMMGGGPAYMYGVKALEAYDQLSA